MGTVHTAFYSPGMGPIPFTLASEAFPLSHREVGTSIAISINFFFAGVLAWFYPNVDERLGHGGSLGLFAVFNIICFVMVFFLVEETKRRSLEELDQIFATPKADFMRFQAMKYLPWFLRRWLLCQHNEPAPKFYKEEIGPALPNALNISEIIMPADSQNSNMAIGLSSSDGTANRHTMHVSIIGGQPLPHEVSEELRNQEIRDSHESRFD